MKGAHCITQRIINRNVAHTFLYKYQVF